MYTSLFKVSVVLASFETETYVSTLCEPVSGVAEPEGDNPNKSENRFSLVLLEVYNSIPNDLKVSATKSFEIPLSILLSLSFISPIALV